MKLRLNSPISINEFTHAVQSKSFVMDASDKPTYNFHQRIYDDACDVGFTVINPKTRVTILVTQEKEMVDGDGEIHGWVFTPTWEDIKGNALLKDYKFLIYND